MNSLARNLDQNQDPDPIAAKVSFTDDLLCVHLSDGREIREPIAFYPRLKNATPTQRANCEIGGLGTGLHWPDVDEDLSVEGIVAGRPARFSHESDWGASLHNPS